jgi:hypothetical protein
LRHEKIHLAFLYGVVCVAVAAWGAGDYWGSAAYKGFSVGQDTF